MTGPWGQSPGGAGREGRRSLLGTYPVPTADLVGAPPTAAPGSPSRWEPLPPPLQYGIDYTFLHQRNGSRPVCWRPDVAVTVRMAGPHQPEQALAVAGIVAELAGLTGLVLQFGGFCRQAPALDTVPAQEIHIGFLPTVSAARPFRPCAGGSGLGGAVAAPGMRHYSRAIALVAVGGSNTSGSTNRHDQPSRGEVATVRHMLAHALGLGHAARRDLLMYHRISDGMADFGLGDRHGLSLLNERNSEYAGG